MKGIFVHFVANIMLLKLNQTQEKHLAVCLLYKQLIIG